jgi:hypothetical protein
MGLMKGGILFFLAIFPATSLAGIIHVSNGENLAAKINGAQGGDTVLVAVGIYGGFRIENRVFTQAAPLVIRAAPGARPLIRSADWYVTPISNSSYVVFDGFILDGGGQPVYCTDVDHLILANLEIRNTGQEAVHIRGSSRYVDILNCHIHHTGFVQPQWAEGIYIGSGSQPYMNSEYIWIEGNDIHHTGNSEGINVKAQSYHVTLRGNKVHDIAPGTASQFNQAAISLEAADLGFKPGVDPGIWIEDNEIYNVAFGRWANGIQATTMGPRIRNNHIHDCAEYCLFFNNFLDGPGSFETVLHDNRTENCGVGARNSSPLRVAERDPGPNPNRPQSWYQAGTPIRGNPRNRKLPAIPAEGSVSFRDLRGRRLEPGDPGSRFRENAPGGSVLIRMQEGID